MVRYSEHLQEMEMGCINMFLFLLLFAEKFLLDVISILIALSSANVNVPESAFLSSVEK